MVLRDLVMGGGGCAVPGTSSSANPLGSLAETLFGSASKTQERLQELPALPGLEEPSSSELLPSHSLPGLEYEQQVVQHPNAQVSGFLRGFHGPDYDGYQDAWSEINAAQMPLQPHLHENASHHEFERLYNQEAVPVLSGFLRSFLDSSRSEVPFHPVSLPQLGLSDGDKLRIQNRSSVMAHHVFADKGHAYANAQVNALLHSLDIEPDLRSWGPQGGHHSQLEEYWNEAHARRLSAMQNGGVADISEQCATEFSRQWEGSRGPQHWVEEFQQQPADGWANQFTEEQSKASTRVIARDREAEQQLSCEQSRVLAETIAQNPDPKFQNSKFFQFVSKMIRGELIAEDNQVKRNETEWANEFASTQQANSNEQWAAEFTAEEHAHRGDNWVQEFSQPGTSANEGWVDEFSKLTVKEWADEFGEQFSNSAPNVNADENWLDSYEKYMEEQANLPSSSKWVYVFADQNPYVGHANPLKEGQELFRHGLLSEAVLALEAEALKNPDNAEGWRLLGFTHAENDDDRQSIAAMMRARDAEPTNIEVLLSLGVSYTNELEQQEALKYLRAWLQHHPKYGGLIPVDQVSGLNHSEVIHHFYEAAKMAPEDADVHTVLGVLYNLSREYNRAIEAFRTALQLKPRDYSLWNKLGATQANSARSADALHAYQEALDLKPNYVRAWSNMGISYANQGRYEESVCYYVRALGMNPKAENAWECLHISLSIAGRGDLVDACDRRDLDLLQQEYRL